MSVVQNSFTSNNLGNTTNNTPLTVCTVPAPPSSSAMFDVKVMGIRTSDGATKTLSFAGSWKRVGSAAPVVSSELLKIGGSTGDQLALLLATGALDVSGNDIIVKVVGLGTNMEWYVDVTNGIQIEY